MEPEGTFYILVRSPLEDDERFCDILRSHDVFVLPGRMFETPGWFRISITANDDMVERALPGFAKAIAEVGA
jgi:aspartate aminotransferase